MKLLTPLISVTVTLLISSVAMAQESPSTIATTSMQGTVPQLQPASPASGDALANPGATTQKGGLETIAISLPTQKTALTKSIYTSEFLNQVAKSIQLQPVQGNQEFKTILSFPL
ncbi:MAG: hypothetical protein HC780_14915 [Leptolyngbyaceae cyanobacterium CSU_1_3]|nr:hypothetical protein [Leptolyngbyaceae cyanobacterium CSU_1_3]